MLFLAIQSKTQSVKNAFLDLAHFYHRFFLDFDAKATPLTELFRQNKPDEVKPNE